MLMGGWNREQAVVFLCAASIRAQGMDQEEILRHELIHVIQDLHQGALLPEPLFSILARETIPSGEVMMVIASGDDANRELECRLLTRMLSTPVVAQWLTESAAKNRQGVVEESLSGGRPALKPARPVCRWAGSTAWKWVSKSCRSPG